MTDRTKEKVLILGALFHDIGKFEQRCTKNPDKKKHQVLGVDFVDSGLLKDKFIRILGEDGFNSFKNIISEHHRSKTIDLTGIVQIADHLSASERVNKESDSDTGTYIDWSNKHLSSVFSKIRLMSDSDVPPRYFRQELLTKDKENYEIIIPEELTKIDIKGGQYAYKANIFEKFTNDIDTVLSFYQEDEDFGNLVNVLLMVFEKYLWCIPDFTGSPATDISLYNHLKDVAGFSHAILRNRSESQDSTKLNLIIGDIPGIQKYIFDIVNTKPAKILRGRSIFVQVLTRLLASKFLSGLGLYECSLIMQAGGKFYILAPSTSDIKNAFKTIKEEIEAYLFDQFRMDLAFNSAIEQFDYIDLMEGKTSFGQIVEDASFTLNRNKNKLFYGRLFGQNESLNNFVWKEEYLPVVEGLSDNMKCKVTDKPIRDKYEGKIPTYDENNEEKYLDVTRQVEIEFKIGDKITGDNVVIPVLGNGLSIDADRIERIKDFNKRKSSLQSKVLLNPELSELLELSRSGSQILKETHYLQVANFCSKFADKDSVLPFDQIAKFNEGAEYLTLIKGDIDNLGLIMAYGLSRDSESAEKGMSAISRTTTLSNHLKYYFSFFLNGFLQDWEKKDKENKVYTIFAGGDDLMLITPQSSAVKLLAELNEKFNDFVCANPEVHISYSVTHFKDHTPIRLVADIAEENQKEGKSINKWEQLKLVKDKNKEAFLSKNDKSSVFVFDTPIKNNELRDLLNELNQIVCWVKEKKYISLGIIRKLLYVSESLRKYEKTKDPNFLIWHARLTYLVNRLLKDKNNKYKYDETPEIGRFFDDVLKINKNESTDLKQRLYPLICQTIFNLRNIIGE
ncbi:MAG: type III-A CRISPR-associated protein Cas10/Csm1 [Ignavibacteriaceae bacterium]|nr:type III-A CRISPR-associated protein Cas10/Csm1 [Ignavibacteriaceae bacterium]